MKRSDLVTLRAFGAAVAAVLVLFPRPAGAQTCSDTQFGPEARKCDATAFPITSPLFVAITDVTGDGKQDVVVVQNGAVPVLVGNGDGSLVCPTAAFVTGPANPTYLVTGDFDRDGKADVAVAANTQVYVFRGTDTPNPGIGAATAYTAGGGILPKALAVLDADQDGDLDIVASDPTTGSGTIRLLQNDGSGGFSTTTSLFTNQQAKEVFTGDFNDDDRTDLVLLRNNTVGIAINNGAGFDAPVTNYPFTGTPPAVSDVAVADFDRDGLADVAVVSKNPDQVITRLGLGDAAGSLGPEIFSVVIGANPDHVAVGDFNGDPYPDLAVTHNALTDVDIALGTTTPVPGSFVAGPSRPINPNDPVGVADGDLSGDGLDDVVVLVGGLVFVSPNATGAECVHFVTARATGGSVAGSGVNDLEWVNPAIPPTGPWGVRIRYNPATTGICAAAEYPADKDAGSSIGPADSTFAGAGKKAFQHASLDPNTTYCYSLFVNKDGTNFSPRLEISSRPFDSTDPGTGTGHVLWAFSTGAAALAPPGSGAGRVHANANNNNVFAMTKGPAVTAPVASGGGIWPANWTPKPMNGPSQGRPSTVAFPIGSASRVIFAGSQDGYVYALDADTGAQAWRSPELGAIVQAQPSGFFQMYTGNHDYVLVGSRSDDANNAFYALQASDGTIAWTYTGAADGKRIGPISGQAAVDYANRRVYFTCRKRLTTAPDGPLGPDNGTVWALDLETGALVWVAAVGNVSQAPTLRGDRLYVGSDDGYVHALEVNNNGQEAPGWPYLPNGGGEGRVKGYVATDRLTQDLYFSTTSKLWKVTDSATGPLPGGWSRGGAGDPEIVSPSTPVFIPGTTVVYVGAGGPGNGRLYRLDAGNGGTLSFYPLGTTNAQVGSPTIDVFANTLYVGSEGGVVYAIALP